MFSQTKRIDERVVEIKLSGRVSGREYHEICELLSEAVQKRARVDLFCELDESFRGISLPVLWRAAVASSERLIKLRRIAVVGARKSYKWARVMVRAFHAETRYFDRAHRTRAFRWLEKGTVNVESGSENALAGDADYRIEQRPLSRSRRQGRNGFNRKRDGQNNGHAR
jgi:hypothetical protein